MINLIKLERAFKDEGILTTIINNTLLIHGGDPWGTMPSISDHEVIKLSIDDDRIIWSDDIDTRLEKTLMSIDDCVRFFYNRVQGQY